MIIFEDTQISYEKESQHTSTAGQQTQQKSKLCYDSNPGTKL